MTAVPPYQHIPPRLLDLDRDLSRIADKYGTPLYVYDESVIRASWDQLLSAVPRSVDVYYSVKANPNIWVINCLSNCGASAEVASVGECIAALRAGVPRQKIIMVGPGKSGHTLRFAVVNKIKAIVIESLEELEHVEAIATEEREVVDVALRVNPGHGSGAIAMGGPTQFGLDEKTVLDILLAKRRYPHVRLVGIHSYLGTGVLDWNTVVEQTACSLSIASDLERASGIQFEFVDVGGGLGVPYYSGDKALDTDALRRPLRSLIEEYLGKPESPCTVAIESGRFLVGPSGVFLTRVLSVKTRSNRLFVVLDGGINNYGYDDRYRGVRPPPVRLLAKRPMAEHPVTLCGPLCTTSDRLAVNLAFPLPEPGDLLAFYQAGAYAFTANPGLFLSYGFPAEVLLRSDGPKLIRRRFSAEDALEFQTPLPSPIA
jgi:diaminopimelate decarboxylase